MAPPIRVALLGYGLAGAVFHAPLITAVEGLELAAIVTRSEERRSRARREHPEAVLLDSADDVWERAGEFDLAVVASPNRFHASKFDLEAGAKSEARASLVCLVDRLSTRSAPPSRSRSQSTSATVSPRRTAPELRTIPQTPTQANWPHV